MRLRLPLHGRSHLSTGSDPIFFDFGVAKATFTASEINSHAIKTLVRAEAGSIILPLAWFLTTSDDFTWSSGIPALNLEAGAAVWLYGAHNLDAFGTTYFTNSSTMIGEDATDAPQLVVTGESLVVRAADAETDPDVGPGTVETWVQWMRCRITTFTP